MEVGAAQGRRLRQSHEQRGLRLGEAAGLRAEPGAGARAHALQIAAHRRVSQVQGENLVLRQDPLERQGHPDLPRLAAPGAGRAVLDQARDLHRQRGSAGDDSAVGDGLAERTRHRPRVHAAVTVEAPVLVRDQHRQVAGIHPFRRRRQPPAPLRDGERAQQPAIGGEHLDRGVGRQRWQLGRRHPALDPEPDGQRQHQQRHHASPRAHRQRRPRRPRPPSHGPMVTRPVTPTARCVGRYRSSTAGAG